MSAGRTQWRLLRSQCALAALVGLLSLLPFGHAAFAGQVASAASIIGQVTDESGAVLPGVTVTATSPSLQVGTMVGVTDERGEYRLTPLPLGDYTVDYELTGFQQVRHENVRLTTGFVAKLDVALKVGSLQETVTVSGASPVVDVTTAVTTRRLSAEELDLIPSSRNSFIGVIGMAPAVRMNLDVGGNTFTTIATFRAYGQERESYSTIEGVLVTALRGGGGNGSYIDFASIEESQVNTNSSDASMPTRGIQLGVVVKSGGNTFHGSGFGAYTSGKLQSDNLDDRLRADGLTRGNPLNYRYDTSGELGGRIVPDKLWFYGSARVRGQAQEVLGAVDDTGAPAIVPDRQELLTTKISSQLNQKNRLIGFYQSNHKYALSTTRFTRWDARGLVDSDTKQGKIEWQMVPSSSLVLSLQQGHWSYYSPHEPFGTEPRTTDTVTGVITGGGVCCEMSTFGREHTTGRLSWYRPNAFMGNHEVKVGFDYMYNWGSEAFEVPNPAANYTLVFNDGAPLQVERNNWPIKPREVTHYTALYATDTWSIQRRLTLNVGLRYAHDVGLVPAGCREAPPAPANLIWPAFCYDARPMKTFNPISPRVRMAWDVFGDGKTSVKGGWGRYTHLRHLFGELDLLDPQGQQTAAFRWRDLNTNRRYDVGEVNFDPNGPDFVSITVGADTVANPDEKEPLTDEFSLSLERELMPNLAVRVTGIGSRTFNIYRTTNLRRPYSAYSIPITRPDPGPDNRVGTADDGGSITYFDYPASLAGKQFELSTFANSEQSQWYKTIEMSAVRRFTGRWMVSASYAATKVDSPLGAVSVYGPADNPNAEINVANHNWEWMGKVSGAYSLPAGVRASLNYEHRSGDLWARTVAFTGGTISRITLPVEPFGSRRLPSINTVDLRLEKTFNLTDGHHVEARANVYNLINANTTLNVGRTSGSSFLRTTSIMPGRVYEFTGTFRF